MTRPRHRRPRKGNLRPTLLVLLACIIGATMGGVANAYWTGSGAGAGTGTTGAAAAAVALSPGTPAYTLHPGGQANVVLTASNPNSAPVFIGSLALDIGQGAGGFAVDASHSGCATSALSFTTQTNAGSGWTIPGKAGAVNGTLAVTLTAALSMDVGAADACQGAIFTVYLVAGQ